MKILSLASWLFSLSLLSCNGLPPGSTPTPTPTPATTPQVGPQPGGELVINYNPSVSSYGPTFSIGYNYGGSQTTISGVTHYELEIGSNQSDIIVGVAGGTHRPTLTKDQTYVVDITSLAGTTVTIKNKNAPTEVHTASITEGTGGDYSSPIFTVISRKHQSGGVDYVRVAVVKGTSFIYFDVNK